jgi:ABC-type polysaccharide/polyol phosphate export permease
MNATATWQSAAMGTRLVELWRYRDLLRNLVARDLKVRYRKSVLGFAWSLVNPLLMMAVFWLVFEFMLKSGVRDYAVFVLVGILPWNWFSSSIGAAIGSVVQNGALINKVYFPREVLPASAVLSNLVNFVLAVPVLIGMLYVAGIGLTRHAVWLPVLIIVQAAFTLGVALTLATLNVYYRDTGVIMEVVLLAWFFLTPIIGGFGLPVRRLAYVINPMASLVASYRVVLYGSETGPPAGPGLDFLARTAVTALAVLALGYWFFVRHSPRFGEEV